MYDSCDERSRRRDGQAYKILLINFSDPFGKDTWARGLNVEAG
jgi:hypothetical protein